MFLATRKTQNKLRFHRHENSQICKFHNSSCENQTVLTVQTVTQQRADCRVDPCPRGLLANDIFPNLVGSKSCTVHANLHNDGLIIEALCGSARRARCLEQRGAYE